MTKNKNMIIEKIALIMNLLSYAAMDGRHIQDSKPKFDKNTEAVKQTQQRTH